jgi:hypothetical protein
VRLQTGVGLAVLVSAAVTILVWRVEPFGIRLPANNGNPIAQSASASAAPLPKSPPVPAANVVRLGNRAELDIPVSMVTKWSVSSPRFGTVTVYVPVGQTPRQALVVELAERGYQVVR